MAILSLSPSPAQQASAPLVEPTPTPTSRVISRTTPSIPLGNDPSDARANIVAKVQRTIPTTTSTTLCEAFHRGHEGSRRRQRRENDRLLSNPHAVPPSAADWEPRPLYPKRHVPYEHASLWDSPAFQERQQLNRSKHQEPVDKVPKDLKARLKRSHGTVGLLRALEEQVREFVLGTQVQEKPDETKNSCPESPVHVNIEDVEDESDEEIVFVSKKIRYQLKRQESMKSYIEDLATEKVLFESLLSDPGASFRRWLVHSIATYYGLKSWSITTGNPAKRLAYVGLRKDNISASPVAKGMPKPLYLML